MKRSNSKGAMVEKVSDGPVLFLWHLLVDGEKSGEAKATIIGPVMTLGDLYVGDPHRYRGWLGGLRNRIVERNNARLRGRGYGRLMVEEVIREAERQGVDRIEGGVTPEDRQTTTDLLGWYRRRGFRVLEEEGESPGWKSIVYDLKRP